MTMLQIKHFFQPKMFDSEKMLWVLIRSSSLRRGASNEYHNICFHAEIRKILCGYPILSGALSTLKAKMRINILSTRRLLLLNRMLVRLVVRSLGFDPRGSGNVLSW